MAFHRTKSSFAGTSLRSDVHSQGGRSREGRGRQVSRNRLAGVSSDCKCVLGHRDEPKAVTLHVAARTIPEPNRRVDWWDKRDGPMIKPDIQHTELDEAAAFACSELTGTVTSAALADNGAGGNVERSEQGRRSIALVVMASQCRLAGTHRQHRLAAVERLDLALLVHAQHDASFGRRHVKADQMAHLDYEIWIAGELEGLDLVRLKAEKRARCAGRSRSTARLLWPCRANSNAWRL